MFSKTVQANLALSVAAFLWGTTFIAQRQAMDHLSPLAYGGLRFTLGALALLPVALIRARRLLAEAENPARLLRLWLMGGLISGGCIFIGVTFQQYGLLWTTAGKAGFITCLYVVLVPLILRCLGQKIVLGEALGAVLAVIGLYYLSFTGGPMSLSKGDALVLIGAFIWAGHVLALAWLAPIMDPIILGTGQALICGVLSVLATLVLGEWPAWTDVGGAWGDILWGGLCSVTFGYTLQIIGQKHARPAPAAIILQMEAVVAMVVGWLFLNEAITGRMAFGAVVMLAGMLLSQLWSIVIRERRPLPAVAEGADG